MEKFEEEDTIIILMGLLAIIIFSVFVYSTFKRGSYEVVSNTKKEYEIVGIKRPKHFQLDLKDLETGYIYKNVSVSRHCNSIYKFNEIKYKFSKENIVYVEVEVDSNFCYKFN
jgi:hypothetical protein